MKKGLLILMLGSSVFANAQSLKDLLYSGKLKNEAGTVIRSSDDLSTKIDTTSKVPTDHTVVTKEAEPSLDSSSKSTKVQTDSAVASNTDDKKITSGITDTTVTNNANAATINTSVPMDNNALFTEYVTTVTNTLKKEVLPSKKIKKGTYYAMFLYTIGTDGQVTIGDVLLTPENSFLQQQIKERFLLDAPQLSPVLSTSGAPRKVNKKYNFTLTKE